jgi:putative transposase
VTAPIDEYTRMCLAIEVGHHIDSRRVIAVLERLIHTHGIPHDLHSDNGPEFVANAIKAWLSSAGIGTADIEPGKLWQSGRSSVSSGSSTTDA